MISRYLKRLSQILKYTALSSKPFAKYNLAILGIARGHPFNESSLLGKVGRTFYPKLKICLDYFGKSKLIINPSDLTHMVILDEFLWKGIYNLSYVNFQPELIIDCGAHIGLFTALAYNEFPSSKIISFEPDPNNFLLLKEMVKVNNMNVEISDSAVANYEGLSSFRINPKSFSSFLLNEQTELTEDNYEEQEVSVINLPVLIHNKKPESLLLKMDIEGEEINLIPELLTVLPRCSAIYFEWHHDSQKRKELFQSLVEEGFVVRVSREVGKYSDNIAIRSS
jgi:FkbM family methyltransferase